jgi:hypothetical protein
MIPHIIRDTKQAVQIIKEREKTVVFDVSEEHPDLLSVFPMADDTTGFLRQYSPFVSEYSTLNDLFMLETFVDQLEKDGWFALALPTAKSVIEQYLEWSVELKVGGLDLKDGLFPFQQFGLRRAFHEAEESRKKVHGFFFNFGTGTGKSVIASAALQELIVQREEIDVALFFTMRKLKVNMARTINGITDVKAVVNDGTKAKRREGYLDESVQCFVMNYEKAKFDYDEIAEFVKGKRVLFIFDEVQKILRGENTKNQSRKAIDKLARECKDATLWPMSASVVKASPLRFHDVFTLINMKNPLGSREHFIETYCDSIDEFQIRPGVIKKTYHWNLSRLNDVRHIVAKQTQTVRKHDPGVREFFKGMENEVVYVQQTREEEKLYQFVIDDAEERKEELKDEFTYGQHFSALRYVANCPEALRYSNAAEIQRMVEKWGGPLPESSKFEMICDKIEMIREQGDQVVVFTKWTYLSLFLFAKDLKARGIRYVMHYGTGMSDDEAQKAQDDFKADPELTVFLSSDAGAYGLNFQNARYVIHIESPTDYDIFRQRSDRIDRADSYLEGLTSYVYVVEGTVEEEIWSQMNHRRKVAAATQGTVEELDRPAIDEAALAERLFSGESQ